MRLIELDPRSPWVEFLVGFMLLRFNPYLVKMDGASSEHHPSTPR